MITDVEAAGLPTHLETDNEAAELSNTNTDLAGDSPSGFRALIREAHIADQSNTEEDSDSSFDIDSTDDDAELDEDIPDDDADADDETEEDEQPTEEETPQRSSRSKNFKELQTANERLTADNSQFKQRIEKFEKQFKTHGGVETVEMAMDIFDKLATGNAEEVVEQLPTATRNKLSQSIFTKAMADHSNRVFGMNHVLREDFGLKADIPQDLMEKTFEFIATRLNEDADDFDEYLTRELEFENTPDREIERLKKQLEATQNPQSESNSDAKTPEQAQMEFVTELNQQYDKFEDDTFQSIAKNEFDAYGLNAVATDTEAIKNAKSILQTMIQRHVGQEMREAQAFMSLAEFWATKDTESQYYKVAAKNFERAMKIKTQEATKSISKLLGATVSRPAQRTASHHTAAIPQSNGRQSIQTTKSRDKESFGFKNALKTVR